MRILSSKKQRKLMYRILALQRITDDLMNNRIDDKKLPIREWADTLDKIAENVSELAEGIYGTDGLLALGRYYEGEE